MTRFYRVHCFKTYGGEDWMKILLALGHCNAKVIGVANDIIAYRIALRAGRTAREEAQTGPILSVRTQQQMAGVPQRDLQPVQPPGRSAGEAKRAREMATGLTWAKRRTVYEK